MLIVKSRPLLYALALLGFCLLPNRILADPLDQWNWRNPVPTGKPLSAIAYGNNQFVSVGDTGTIVTSPDGLTWTSRISGTSNTLYAIASGNNRFVAVGSGTLASAPAAVVASPDGITWTSRTRSVTTNGLAGIGYGNNQFVAVGGAIQTIMARL